jgi:N-acetylneuraminate synthase
MVMLIAEVGSVHDGSFGNARRLIALAAECGADAVKFQTHIAEAETLRSAPSPSYFSAESRFDYFKRTAFALDQWKALAEDAQKLELQFLSSPFSLEAVDLLEAVGVGAYKIPSGEVTNLPLLAKIADTTKPVYLSSGMSNWAELDQAIDVLRSGGPITVLQCSSAYPCPPERVGLNVLSEIADRWGLAVGFSDHTEGFAAGVAAVALGASVIEKHITFSRRMYGSDAATATEPAEFAAFARALKDVARMRANPIDKDDLTPYRDMKLIFEKSLVATRDLAAGAVVEEGDFAFKKPGDGIPSGRWRSFVGRRLTRTVKADEKFVLSDFTEPAELDLETHQRRPR